ncbi:allantoate deiminase [Paenibacillus agri]|uniref:Allantoate deiminase n=1 Tax=Paenibacillus agri TaxID=2744309 RepID=A0A850EH03_9BACL|nr:allantoate deiminase [Paenibacillus agri]NUU60108.1 allantoate deiminase [Paenibacillus agri]
MRIEQQPLVVPSPTDLHQQVSEMIDWLATYGGQGEHGDHGVTRTLYSPAWQAAQSALEHCMREGGLIPRYDDVGNLFGRLSGTEQDGRVILTGSHLDTVVDGGKYDGAYGIIASFIAVRYLKEHYGTPRRSIEVVSLCEEEGSRFPMTYWGSGSMTGIRDMQQVEGIADAEGISFREAMGQAGFGMGIHPSPRRDDLECFIELHVEQGEVLEREGQSIGLVSHIVGQRRYEVTVSGESNHAGTTPMEWRRDALLTAAELIRLVGEWAKRQGDGLVATVGRMEIHPNVGNVIAREVTFSLDVRHPDAEVIRQFCEALFIEWKKIAAAQGTTLTYHKWMDEDPVAMSETLASKAQMILARQGISHRRMTSGAGHDSQVFGTYCPTSLLFVPSHLGISHSPREFTGTDELVCGVRLLIELLYELAY